MMIREFKPTDSQRQAINHLDGRLFIAAGAGSGKTAVVANRYVEAIARGKAEVDKILTITFTRKAAAEMMKRVRKVLRQRMLEDPDPERVERMRRAYRNIESSRISTNDSFYAQVLKANALAAGIDPDFGVADEASAKAMREQAFEAALLDFVERHGAAGTDFVMAYDPKLWGSLFGIIDDIYTTIRSRGDEPKLPAPDPEELYGQRSRRLHKAIDDFDHEVERTGASYPTIGNVQETNWKLKAACSSAQMDVRRQMLEEGKPCAARGALSAEISEIKNAREACSIALDSFKAVETIKLMSDLLETYDKIYSKNKFEAGMMDFADLALRLRDLLAENKSIRRRLSSSFEMIMVDEYQDTNPLQAEITEMINTGNLMMVGDENQSIFGFRDAEVGLFQEEDERAETGDYRIPLVENFRSQPEILDFVDAIFQREGMLGRRYLQLKPMAEIDPSPEECRIEVIMVDKKPPTREKPLPERDAREVEAQLIAERLKKLHGEGYRFGDMAIIMANRKDVELYSEALDRANIKNYLAIGVKFFGRPELGDSINMFRILVNPLDDPALAAVLRSPLVKVSDDTLYWLRQAAGRDRERKLNPLWSSVRRIKGTEIAEATDASDVEGEPIGPLESITRSDRAKLLKFASDLSEMRDYANRHPLQETAGRVVAYNDYAAATAAGPGGKQALANLMKLLDMAAEYEEAKGRDLVAFIEFLGSQRSGETREADAPVEEEGVDSVRIMTMHSAKGLEFPLVVLPKLGGKKSGGRNGKPVVLLDRDQDSGRIGLRYTDPGLDEKIPVFAYVELEAEKADRELEEEKRLIYVAMTRAERHLILTGCGDLEKPGKGNGKGSRPFDWIRDCLALDRKNRPGLDGLDRLEDIEGARVRLQVCVDPDDVLMRAAETESIHELAEAPEPVNPAIGDMTEPAIYVPSVISPTNLDAFNACPRRYYLDKALGLGALLDIGISDRAAIEGGNLNHMEMGSLVHHILEHHLEQAYEGSVTADQFDAAAEAISKAAASSPAQKTLAEADYQRAGALLVNFARAPVAQTLLAAHNAGRLQRELPFQTLVGQTIVQGFIDALCPDDGAGTLVVDYKTSRLSEGYTLEQATATYRYQMASYALAASRLYRGPVRVVLAFLGGDEPVESVREFTQAESAGLEGEIKVLIDSMAPGDFPPLKEFDAHQCNYCPAGPSGARICLPSTGSAD